MSGSGGGGALDNDVNMLSLRQQLKGLNMDREMAEALAPRAAPVDNTQAKKIAREQAGALRREEEHKKVSLRLMFKGLLLYTAIFLFHVEWCIRQL